MTQFRVANLDEIDREVTTINPLPELIPNRRENEGTTPLKIWSCTNNSQMMAIITYSVMEN